MIYAKISRAGSAAVIAPILEASWPQEEPACALYPAFFGGINGPAGGGHFLFFSFLFIFFFFSFLLPLLHGHSGILVPFAIYGTFETLFFFSPRRLFRFTFHSLVEESTYSAD